MFSLNLRDEMKREMELRQLRYFLKVADTLSFSEAGRQLFITQSTLSQQICKLEQEVNMQLFERNSHEVVLTEAGRYLYRYAQKVISSVDDCMQHMEDLRQMLTGELGIGVTFSFNSIAHESVMKFLKKYPNVKLNIYYKTMAELLEMLKGRELDMVLAFKPSVEDKRIESRLLFMNHLAVIGRDNHPLLQQQSVCLEDLQKYTLVLPAHGLQARYALDHLLANHRITLHANVEINNVNQLLGIVRESNYVTVLSESTIMHEPNLKGVRLDCEDNVMEGCIHVLRDSYLKRAAHEFIRMLGESTVIHNLYTMNYLIGK